MSEKSIRKFILFTLFAFILIKSVSAGRSWEYYYDRGISEYRFSNYNEAEYYFLRALEKNEKLYKACNLLADICLKNNRRSDALEYYIKSLEINDSQPDTHCALGEVYEFFLDFDKSLNHYRKAVEYDPNHKKSNYSLVKYYVRFKDRDNADKYIAICSKLGEMADEYYKQGIAWEKKKNLTEALNFFLKAADENPVMAEALFSASEVYRKERDFEKAAVYMEKINMIKPEFRNINSRLGYLYFNASLRYAGTSNKIQKRKLLLKNAVRNFQLAVKNDQDNSELYVLLAQTYRYLGEDEKAFNAMQKAAEIEDSE
ncbi:MAG: tetratricopeptide repeat protein [Spirochaetes bacterium]|nr:tetratricopeptide repeat protein [Spirochaetota bacterium]